MRCMPGVVVFWCFSLAWLLDWMFFPLCVPPFNLSLSLKTLHWQWITFSHSSPAFDPTMRLLQQPAIGCPNNDYDAGPRSHRALRCMWSLFLFKQKGLLTWLHVALAAIWSAYLVFDSIIFLLTIAQTFRLRKELGNIRSITDIFLRDGLYSCPFEMAYSRSITRISVFCVCNICHHKKRLLIKFQSDLHSRCCECNYTAGEFAVSYPVTYCGT